jgi:hypothetical protein
MVSIFIEPQPLHVAGAVNNTDDDGLGVRDAKVNVVAPVNGQAQSASYVISRNSTVPQTCNMLQTGGELGNKPARGLWIGNPDEMIVDFIEIAPSAISDVQAFLFDRVSPRATTSSVNSSALAYR